MKRTAVRTVAALLAVFATSGVLKAIAVLGAVESSAPQVLVQLAPVEVVATRPTALAADVTCATCSF